MRVFQLLHTFMMGDAIGNETTALHRLLKKSGYISKVYAKNALGHVKREVDLGRYFDLPALQPEDIAILHLSTGDEIIEEFRRFPCKKVIRYHNITPAQYFEAYDTGITHSLQYGLRVIQSLATLDCLIIADSEYNRQHLISLGFSPGRIAVVPIVLALEDYRQAPDKKMLRKYRDGKTNILFTGRVAPNKKHEDLLAVFFLYQKYYNPNSRLLLVGSPTVPAYLDKLRGYAGRLGIQDAVAFFGHVSFAQVLAFYRVADVFLCMSEHEGFCVPLVEATYFDVPILARATSAVPDTLGGSGVLLRDQEFLLYAGMLDRLIRNQDLRQQVLQEQRARLPYFAPERVGAQFMHTLQRVEK